MLQDLQEDQEGVNSSVGSTINVECILMGLDNVRK
jgi:hypothetical protein